MSEWIPRIVTITNIAKHPDADQLDITEVEGYPVIVRRDQFKVGDRAVYFPVDTILPDTKEFEFLAPKDQIFTGGVPAKYRRIKAKKIRGIFSQGLLHPTTLSLDCDIINHFQLKKYEYPEESLELNNVNKRGDNACNPKGWQLPYYDIDGLRPNLHKFELGQEVVIMEKLEGCCSTFVHDGEKLWVKSRNWFKKQNPEKQCLWWDVAIRHELEKKLADFPMLAFYGEVYGQVKGFVYDAPVEGKIVSPKVRFFDVFDLKAGKFLDFHEAYNVVTVCKLQFAPVLYRGPYQAKEHYPLAEGQSVIGKNIKEGFVIRSVNNHVQYKLKGQDYLLKKQ